LLIIIKKLSNTNKKGEQDLGRENANEYIRKNGGRIHYIDDD
jgi:hypothetical protein